MGPLRFTILLQTHACAWLLPYLRVGQGMHRAALRERARSRVDLRPAEIGNLISRLPSNGAYSAAVEIPEGAPVCTCYGYGATFAEPSNNKGTHALRRMQIPAEVVV